MNGIYYDNAEIKQDTFGNVEVDRVYYFDFSRFDEGAWSVMENIYRSLPNQSVKNGIGQQMWFGEEDISDSFLWSSVEPSGLQVVGYLKKEDWDEWKTAFHRLIRKLPFYDV